MLAAPAQARVPLITQPEAIAVNARPIAHFKMSDSAQARFGALEFRGGLELTSPHGAFGGLSGIAMDADGQGFLAISDVGSWLRAKINYDAGGRAKSLADCVIAPMLNANGIPLKRTKWFDTESLALDNGVAFAGIERQNDIFRFDWAKDGFAARGRPISVPPNFKKLPHNRGCEGLGVAPKSSPLAGSLVGIAERAGDRGQPTTGFILTGPVRGEFSYALHDGFEVTDLTFMPNGDMLVLERFYSPFRGVGMRIRRVDGQSVQPGALLDGSLLIDADLGYNIDNMEALGLHRAGNGQFILTLLSDDNFSLLQRTILLQFAIV